MSIVKLIWSFGHGAGPLAIDIGSERRGGNEQDPERNREIFHLVFSL